MKFLLLKLKSKLIYSHNFYIILEKAHSFKHLI